HADLVDQSDPSALADQPRRECLAGRVDLQRPADQRGREYPADRASLADLADLADLAVPPVLAAPSDPSAPSALGPTARWRMASARWSGCRERPGSGRLLVPC